MNIRHAACRTLPLLLCAVFFCTAVIGCASTQKKNITTTAYCGCGTCCGWTRGSWKYLKLDFWNRYYKSNGRPYRGKTASGTEPREARPGLFSLDSVTHPWMIPIRILLPWRIFPQTGTIAADTKHYPFGTVMQVPGYGRGVVEDRGSAIKGPARIDLYMESHGRARQWGRKTLPVKVDKK